MAKVIDGNVYIRINKNKIDTYPLTGKVRNYALKNDATYILVNDRNKLVGYYVFKLINREFKLVHVSFEDKYKDLIPAFEEKIIKDMKQKIIVRVANRAELQNSIVTARPTPISFMNQVSLFLGLTVLLMLLTKQYAVMFLIGIVITYIFGINVNKK